MPRNPQSEARKSHIVLLVESRLGSLKQNHTHRTDWHSSRDDAVDVFITDSIAHFGHRPWFDMTRVDIEKLAMHPNGFIIFVLGDETNFLVVPAKHLLNQLPNYQAGPRSLEEDRFHFNVAGIGFAQLPNWDLRPYAQKIELIPSKSE